MLLGSHNQLSPNLPEYARGKIAGGGVIHRNHHHSPQYTSEEDRDPLGTVLAPDHHPITFGDPMLFQKPRKSAGKAQYFAIGV